MATSCVMSVLSLSFTFLALSAAQETTMPPSSMAAPPTIAMPPFMSPPAPVAFPPTMSPGPSVSSSPAPGAPDMAPLMPASPPAPMGPGPVSSPAPAPTHAVLPSSAFVHGSSMAMVALIGSAALFF
uniref:Classical arabinogalactan protein 9-like n=1 Tax=Nicotiana sylvestris TaxID=4096 RepID=A0A1U7W0J9_NICSY|nr:PREDICTED: classical arabinogalactan protein 9-like [Nicotiana sylvestris]